MQKERKENALERGFAVMNDVLGLPPGDKTPHGQGRPARDPNVPHGSLTADDAEGVPTPHGTGSKAK